MPRPSTLYSKCSTVSAAYLAEHPGTPAKQLPKLLKAQYKTLSKKEKQPWVDKAAAATDSTYKAAAATDATYKAAAATDATDKAVDATDKAPKAPKVAKRAPSAYNLFIQDPANRKQVLDEAQTEDLKVPTVVMSALGHKWKSLSAEAKQPWLEKAAEAKAAFQATAPAATAPKVAKRAPSAYNLFIQDAAMRASVQKEGEAMSAKDIMSALGHKWKSLSAEAKQPWLEKAAEAKAAFQATAPAAKPRKVAKRAPSAYNLFVQDAAMRASVQKEGEAMSAPDMMRALGAKWKSLTEEAKQPWLEKAAEAKAKAQVGVVAVEAVPTTPPLAQKSPRPPQAPKKTQVSAKDPRKEEVADSSSNASSPAEEEQLTPFQTYLQNTRLRQAYQASHDCSEDNDITRGMAMAWMKLTEEQKRNPETIAF